MYKLWQKLLSLVLAIALVLAIPLVSRAAPGDTSRVSRATDGTQGDNDSSSASISADGRYVAFASEATNLVSGDTNGYWDVFVHDTQTGATSRVSRATNGTQADSASYYPAISGDGRYVAFGSYATNLVSGDTNGDYDIFLHDTQTGTTSRVSRATDGTQADSASYYSAISGDGRYVAFYSHASNLVSGDTNGYWDVFIHDTQTGTTNRVSRATDGTQGNDDSRSPAISADGRYVAFHSYATNLVSGDTNGYWDVFLHDTQTGATSRVSQATDGTQGNDLSYHPAISADGRYMAFHSYATNLVSGDTNGYWDVFVHDTQTGATSRVSLATDGTQGNDDSSSPASSGDGRYVAFDSFSANLVSGDTNGYWDVFVHENDIDAPTVTAITRADPNPTSAASVGFNVTFSENVVDLDTADFALTTSGTLSGASVTGLSGTGAAYTVAVSTGTDAGTLRLDIPATATVSDLVGNPLSGLPYTAGEWYTVLIEIHLPMVIRDAP